MVYYILNTLGCIVFHKPIVYPYHSRCPMTFRNFVCVHYSDKESKVNPYSTLISRLQYAKHTSFMATTEKPVTSIFIFIFATAFHTFMCFPHLTDITACKRFTLAIGGKVNLSHKLPFALAYGAHMFFGSFILSPNRPANRVTCIFCR